MGSEGSEGSASHLEQLLRHLEVAVGVERLLRVRVRVRVSSPCRAPGRGEGLSEHCKQSKHWDG